MKKNTLNIKPLLCCLTLCYNELDMGDIQMPKCCHLNSSKLHNLIWVSFQSAGTWPDLQLHSSFELTSLAILAKLPTIEIPGEFKLVSRLRLGRQCLVWLCPNTGLTQVHVIHLLSHRFVTFTSNAWFRNPWINCELFVNI